MAEDRRSGITSFGDFLEYLYDTAKGKRPERPEIIAAGEHARCHGYTVTCNGKDRIAKTGERMLKNHGCWSDQFTEIDAQ